MDESMKALEEEVVEVLSLAEGQLEQYLKKMVEYSGHCTIKRRKLEGVIAKVKDAREKIT